MLTACQVMVQALVAELGPKLKLPENFALLSVNFGTGL